MLFLVIWKKSDGVEHYKAFELQKDADRFKKYLKQEYQGVEIWGKIIPLQKGLV